jgi:hypothetical protein
VQAGRVAQREVVDPRAQPAARMLMMAAISINQRQLERCDRSELSTAYVREL